MIMTNQTNSNNNKNNSLSGDKGLFQFLFPKIIENIENIYDIKLKVDHYILIEVFQRVEKLLKSYNLEDPNEAKKASAAAFWIRKLKPVSYENEVPLENYMPYINEISGLLFSIISYYTPKTNKNSNISTILRSLKNDRVLWFN